MLLLGIHLECKEPHRSKVHKYLRADSGWDREVCVIFRKTASRESKNCHASSYIEDYCLFVFKGLVMPATEEERDGHHQESAMDITGTGECREKQLEFKFIRLDRTIRIRHTYLYFHLGLLP